MSVRTVSKQVGFSRVGSVAASHASKKRQIRSVTTYLDQVSTAKDIGIRIETEDGKNTIINLSQAIVPEIVKGLLENASTSWLIADEQLLNIFRAMLATEQQETAAIQNFLKDLKGATTDGQ